MINTTYLDKLCREYNELDEKINKLSLYIEVNINVVDNKYCWIGGDDGHFCGPSLLIAQLREMEAYRASLSERINGYLIIREHDNVGIYTRLVY
jgi:hypothetical protein